MEASHSPRNMVSLSSPNEDYLNSPPNLPINITPDRVNLNHTWINLIKLSKLSVLRKM